MKEGEIDTENLTDGGFPSDKQNKVIPSDNSENSRSSPLQYFFKEDQSANLSRDFFLDVSIVATRACLSSAVTPLPLTCRETFTVVWGVHDEGTDTNIDGGSSGTHHLLTFFSLQFVGKCKSHTHISSVTSSSFNWFGSDCTHIFLSGEPSGGKLNTYPS